jgi:hypothetical protein
VKRSENEKEQTSEKQSVPALDHHPSLTSFYLLVDKRVGKTGISAQLSTSRPAMHPANGGSGRSWHSLAGSKYAALARTCGIITQIDSPHCLCSVFSEINLL